LISSFYCLDFSFLSVCEVKLIFSINFIREMKKDVGGLVTDKQRVLIVEKVPIRPGVSVLSILRHLNYKPWFALAEFVDNALQSYIANRERLELLHGHEFKLCVEIVIETVEPARILIKDNAAGIATKDFARAFRPAVCPPDIKGLSEFGMGMKSASCWFASSWQVRTKALGEATEKSIRFDIQKIINDQIEELEINEREASLKAHFTEIILDGLHHLPVKRTLGK
jgi:hypothetical protein